MDKYIYDENNGLWYELQGDHYIPCPTIPKEEQRPIGIWGRWHLRHIREYRKGLYNNLILNRCTAVGRMTLPPFFYELGQILLKIFGYPYIIYHVFLWIWSEQWKDICQQEKHHINGMFPNDGCISIVRWDAFPVLPVSAGRG